MVSEGLEFDIPTRLLQIETSLWQKGKTGFIFVDDVYKNVEQTNQNKGNITSLANALSSLNPIDIGLQNHFDDLGNFKDGSISISEINLDFEALLDNSIPARVLDELVVTQSELEEAIGQITVSFLGLDTYFDNSGNFRPNSISVSSLEDDYDNLTNGIIPYNKISFFGERNYNPNSGELETKNIFDWHSVWANAWQDITTYTEDGIKISDNALSEVGLLGFLTDTPDLDPILADTIGDNLLTLGDGKYTVFWNGNANATGVNEYGEMSDIENLLDVFDDLREDGKLSFSRITAPNLDYSILGVITSTDHPSIGFDTIKQSLSQLDTTAIRDVLTNLSGMSTLETNNVLGFFDDIKDGTVSLSSLNLNMSNLMTITGFADPNGTEGQDWDDETDPVQKFKKVLATQLSGSQVITDAISYAITGGSYSGWNSTKQNNFSNSILGLSQTSVYQMIEDLTPDGQGDINGIDFDLLNILDGDLQEVFGFGDEQWIDWKNWKNYNPFNLEATLSTGTDRGDVRNKRNVPEYRWRILETDISGLTNRFLIDDDPTDEWEGHANSIVRPSDFTINISALDVYISDTTDDISSLNPDDYSIGDKIYDTSDYRIYEVVLSDLPPCDGDNCSPSDPCDGDCVCAEGTCIGVRNNIFEVWTGGSNYDRIHKNNISGFTEHLFKYNGTWTTKYETDLPVQSVTWDYVVPFPNRNDTVYSIDGTTRYYYHPSVPRWKTGKLQDISYSTDISTWMEDIINIREVNLPAISSSLSNLSGRIENLEVGGITFDELVDPPPLLDLLSVGSGTSQYDNINPFLTSLRDYGDFDTTFISDFTRAVKDTFAVPSDLGDLDNVFNSNNWTLRSNIIDNAQLNWEYSGNLTDLASSLGIKKLDVKELWGLDFDTPQDAIDKLEEWMQKHVGDLTGDFANVFDDGSSGLMHDWDDLISTGQDKFADFKEMFEFVADIMNNLIGSSIIAMPYIQQKIEEGSSVGTSFYSLSKHLFQKDKGRFWFGGEGGGNNMRWQFKNLYDNYSWIQNNIQERTVEHDDGDYSFQMYAPFFTAGISGHMTEGFLDGIGQMEKLGNLFEGLKTLYLDNFVGWDIDKSMW